MERKKKRILVVDPGEEVLDLVENLRDIGYEVVVDAGKGVLKRLDREWFDLVILEIMIPTHSWAPFLCTRFYREVECISFQNVRWESTGLRLFELIRRREFRKRRGTAPDVPVIFYTAVGDYGVIEKVKALPPVLGYFKKPTYIDEIVEVIERHI